MSFTNGLEIVDNSSINYAYLWTSLYLALRGNKVISGCEVTESVVAGLKVDVSSGFVWSNGAKITVPTETDFSLATQHATLAVGEAMYVMIVYDESAVGIAALDGTKSDGDIFPPAFDDSSQVLLGLIRLTEADTEVNEADIDDMRLFIEQGAYFSGDIHLEGNDIIGTTFTLSNTELSYLEGITSTVQTQLNTLSNDLDDAGSRDSSHLLEIIGSSYWDDASYYFNPANGYIQALADTGIYSYIWVDLIYPLNKGSKTLRLYNLHIGIADASANWFVSDIDLYGWTDHDSKTLLFNDGETITSPQTENYQVNIVHGVQDLGAYQRVSLRIRCTMNALDTFQLAWVKFFCYYA